MNEMKECVICLSEMIADVYELNCGHKYHFNCIGQWFSKTPNCPICRQAVTGPTLLAYFGTRFANTFTPVHQYLNELRTESSPDLMNWFTPPSVPHFLHVSTPYPPVTTYSANIQAVTNSVTTGAAISEPNSPVISQPAVVRTQVNGTQPLNTTRRPNWCWNHSYIRRHRPIPYQSPPHHPRWH